MKWLKWAFWFTLAGVLYVPMLVLCVLGEATLRAFERVNANLKAAVRKGESE